MNSYRFKSSSPSRYKLWTPDIQKEEIYRKKKFREDKYIHEFDEQDRPVLLIQKKDDYVNQHMNVVQNPEEGDNYFKISENTQEVEDVKDQIMSQSTFIRRETQMHSKKKDLDNSTHLYKIEGIEFLPEGFLELDPLLYHDEYAFENDLHKDLFSEEQRRLKAMRRKQYGLKNKTKMRNVTLFIADEKTERVV